MQNAKYMWRVCTFRSTICITLALFLQIENSFGRKMARKILLLLFLQSFDEKFTLCHLSTTNIICTLSKYVAVIQCLKEQLYHKMLVCYKIHWIIVARQPFCQNTEKTKKYNKNCPVFPDLFIEKLLTHETKRKQREREFINVCKWAHRFQM